ncbi:MAG: class I SAM-dependent methyltransferase [Azospirillaceae bacterium]
MAPLPEPVGSAGAPPALDKMAIVNLLARRFGYRRFLELSTPTTGLRFDRLDRQQLTEALRIEYGREATGSRRRGGSEQPADWSTDGLDIAAPLAALDAAAGAIDIALVDPFHTYDQSLRDIEAVWRRLRPGGALVVHDCLPGHPALVSPNYVDGAWCGETYRAFVDITRALADPFVTVDVDYGCGVIARPGQAARDEGLAGVLATVRRGGHADTRYARYLEARWSRLADDGRRFRFFRRHRRRLANVIGGAAFIRLLAAASARPIPVSPAGGRSTGSVR